MKEGRHEMYLKRGKKFDERKDKNLEFTRRKVELASPADFQHDLIPHSTQETSSDDDRDSILDPFVFSDAELPDEDLGELKLIPTVDSQILKHVRHRARDEMDCLKSPEPYTKQLENGLKNWELNLRKIDSFGRVPALALPKPLPFSSNFAENVVMTNSTSKSDKEIAVASTSKSDKEIADVSEVVEIQEKTDDAEDLSNLSDESGYDLIQQQVEAVKDPNYQPSTSEYRQILDDESFDNDFDQTVDEKESDIDFVLDLEMVYQSESEENDNTSSKRFELNVSLTTAAVTIGLSYSNIMSIFSVVRAPFISKTTFYETRRLGVVPAINKVFMEQRQKIIKILKQINIPIDAAGDGMYDSRGYCAFWCRYIIICTLTKFVLHYKNVRKTAGKGSKGLEPIAQSQCLSELVDMLKETFVNVDPIRSLTTDRDLAVAANMKNQFPKIIHRFDLWHLIRNLTMDIWPKKDQKQMIPIKPWIQAIINNVYSSIQNSGGDPIIARELVMSSFAHCLDQHSNFQNITWYKFTKVNQCRHSPTSTSHVGFLNPNNVKDMKAWEALRKIFVKGNRLNDIGQISAHFMTSECESFNALSKKYAPKDKYFSSHETTTRLAVLHWNHLKIEELEGRRTVIGEELSKKSNNLQEEEKEESSDEEFSLENLTDKDYFEKRLQQVFDEFESSSEKSESDSDSEESDEPDEAD
ncbi:unnamed protein product [Caenorhabditis angaria]|uniref:Uncharacterized protein n=1 Tax=Caenorhabditis angaria TaxID=860376 RepID=A0A9P1IDG6_9PELO|nr:unnamed protein product [Caenorhabditis angaria]